MAESKDAISILKAQHKKVKAAFKQFDNLIDESPEEAYQIGQQIIGDLTMHAFIEEKVFYPTMMKALGSDEDNKDLLNESKEEHHVVHVLLTELANMRPGQERYKAKMTVLKELVQHHVDEEETELFPEARSVVSRKVMAEIGEAMLELMDQAPSKPSIKEEQPERSVVDRLAELIEK
jgi:hemerythrin-like domain-containing protein